MNRKSLDKVLVLLVDHNSADLVPDVLKSIQEDSVDVSILLMANGSSDSSYSQLQKINDARVHLIRSKENLGFAGGNNFALKYALQNMGEFNYVFLLNTDAYIEQNLIGGLKDILEKEKNAACVSPKIFDRNGKVWYGGSNLDFKRGVVTSSVPIDEQNNKLFYNVDVFNGCAVLFRTDKFLEAGLLNEKLFLYYEEADCSLRIKNLGYSVLYAPKFTVLHDVSYSSRNFSFVKTYYMTRNKFLVFDKTMTTGAKIYYVLHQFAYLIKNRKYKNAVYHIKGLVDFKKGRTGKLASKVY